MILIVGTSISNAAEDRTYIIGYNDGSPFAYLARDRLKLVYERAKLKVEFVSFPSRRSLENANNGNTDGDVARVLTIQKKYPNLRRVNVELIYLNGMAYSANPKILNYEESLLGKYRIGSVGGVRWSEDKLKGYKSKTVNKNIQLLEMLLLDRIDIVFVTEASGDTIIRDRKEFSSIRKLQPPVITLVTHHYVHKKNVEIIPILEEAIRSIRNDKIWTD